MAVKLRMKMMGRKHRPFFRICAVDARRPRDGRVLEEVGTYDPMIADTDARVVLKADRLDYWLSVGAQPSDKVKVLIKKYGSNGTHVAVQASARDRLAQPKFVPPAPAPVIVVKSKAERAAEEAAAQAAARAASSAAEASAAESTETVASEAAAE